MRLRRGNVGVEFADRPRGIEIADEAAQVIHAERGEGARLIPKVRTELRVLAQCGKLKRASQAMAESDLASRAQTIAVRVLGENRCHGSSIAFAIDRIEARHDLPSIAQPPRARR